jgi:hypothetical protein
LLQVMQCRIFGGITALLAATQTGFDLRNTH